MVELSKIEYTQPGISFSTKDRATGEQRSVGRMAAQMRRSGWDVSQPADIVRMRDGRLVSLDHRRMWAAERAGNITHVSARVHAETARLSAAEKTRFAIDKKGVPSGTNPVTNQAWKAGDKPGNWGDAVRFRSAVQEFGKAGKQGTIGYDPGRLAADAEGNVGTRDPKFPAAGSKDLPMRVQPGPLTRHEPYQGAGTVIKGGKRTTVQSGAGANAAGEIRPRSTPPAGGTSGGGPNVVVDPSLQAGGASAPSPGVPAKAAPVQLEAPGPIRVPLRMRIGPLAVFVFDLAAMAFVQSIYRQFQKNGQQFFEAVGREIDKRVAGLADTARARQKQLGGKTMWVNVRFVTRYQIVESTKPGEDGSYTSLEELRIESVALGNSYRAGHTVGEREVILSDVRSGGYNSLYRQLDTTELSFLQPYDPSVMSAVDVELRAIENIREAVTGRSLPLEARLALSHELDALMAQRVKLGSAR